jgi:pimeloyl-ACP methyl ester carboxylesterase
VLVGHSYGGMVITGAAEHLAERLRHLVYVDALAPRDGESALSISPAWRRDEILEEARTWGGGVWVPFRNSNDNPPPPGMPVLPPSAPGPSRAGPSTSSRAATSCRTRCQRSWRPCCSGPWTGSRREGRVAAPTEEVWWCADGGSHR